MNGLSWERVSLQREAILPFLKACIGCEQVLCEPPEPLLEAVQIIAALNAHFLHHVLVEIVEQLVAGVPLPLRNFSFQITLERVELKLNLFWRPALLVDGGDAFLKVHA